MLKYEVVKQIPVIDPSVPNVDIDTANLTQGLIGTVKSAYSLNPYNITDQVYARGTFNNIVAGYNLGPQQEVAIGIDLEPLQKSDINMMLDVSGTIAITTGDEGSVDDITILPYIGINHYTDPESGSTSINYHLLSGGSLGDHNACTYSSQVLFADIVSGGINLMDGVQFGFLIRNNKPTASSLSNTNIRTIVTSLFARYCMQGFDIQGRF